MWSFNPLHYITSTLYIFASFSLIIGHVSYYWTYWWDWCDIVSQFSFLYWSHSVCHLSIHYQYLLYHNEVSDKEMERGIYYYHREMRSSAHGQLFINLCFGLIGLCLSFIIAVHSRNSTILCTLSGTVLQYFFLVSLLIMTAETISIYFVQVLKYKIQSFPLKASLISWSKSM